MVGVAGRRFSENLNAKTDTKLKMPQLGGKEAVKKSGGG
jgi:hypothetical protein